MLAPRALTLTMFLRAFVADVFVHGTGGAAYEAVGDALTERWFSWRPPPFVTATATLMLPLPRFDVTGHCRGRARWDVHHAWHNPHLYAGGLSTEGRRLLDRKRRRLAELESLARFAPERSAAFAELHQLNAELRESLPTALESTRRGLAEVERQLAHNRLAASREAFFALMSREKLLGLIDAARRWAQRCGPP